MKTAVQMLMILALAASQTYGNSSETPPPVPAQEVPEVLNQGPIHEAFAQPIDLTLQAGIIAPVEPPAPITENPAAERPKGSDYVWIPGYWAWDAERNNYVWVSGCWRVPPTGMSWMPGYWNKVTQGWQWVAGFWIPTSQANQVQYLPQPPEIADTEPPAASVVTDQIWVPPCYYWRDNGYILRSGYWLAPQTDWMWIPSHYTWTPYGYVFVPGYWDYVLTSRGVLYAPVYFPRHFHRPVGYTYSLGVVVNIGNLEFSLFSYPRYCHYYFGDYYSDFYIGLGIYPWFEFETRHSWYDPIYAYDRCHYRHRIPHWGEHIRREYDLRRADAGLRPPRTYRELQSRFSGIPKRQRNEIRMVEPIRTYADSKKTPFKFSRMNNKERQKIISRGDDVNRFRQERRQVESRPIAPTSARSSREEIRNPQQGMPEGRGRIERPSEQARSAGRSETEKPSERRAPEAVQTPRESRTPERTAREQSPRVERPSEQARSAEPARIERPREQTPFQRQGAESRRSSERMDFPRSPVTGRSSRGFFQEKTPSRPQRERRVEGGERGQSRDGGRESRDGGGRGRR